MLLLLLLLALASLLLWQRYTKRLPFIRRVDKIPGPPALPFIGNALNLIDNPPTMFAKLRDYVSQYGGLYRLWVLDQPHVVIQRARDAEKILQGMTHHAKSDNYKFFHDWIGIGLGTSNGDRWRVQRKVLTPAFHFNILHEFLPTCTKHAVKMTQCLSTEVNNTQGFNIFHYSSLCSLDIICESSMGTAINAQNKENSSYIQSIGGILEMIVQRFFSPWLRSSFMFKMSPTNWALQKFIKVTNQFTDNVINERRTYLQSLRHDDNDDQPGEERGKRRAMAFIDTILAAEEAGVQHMLTQKDIRDQVSTFLFAGYDTVSTAIAWTIFLLGCYPEIQARVVEELVSVFGDSGRAPDMSDLANLKYLERCIKEALRLYPSLSFIDRAVNSDVHLENYVIPAGSTAFFNIFMLHRDPEFWPNPDKFDPDRFLPENSQGRHAYAYLPFSAGPRNCIGQKFAVMEEKVAISTIFRRFLVTALHTRDEVILQCGIILRPKNGLSITLRERLELPNLRIDEDAF